MAFLSVNGWRVPVTSLTLTPSNRAETEKNVFGGFSQVKRGDAISISGEALFQDRSEMETFKGLLSGRTDYWRLEGNASSNLGVYQEAGGGSITPGVDTSSDFIGGYLNPSAGGCTFNINPGPEWTITLRAYSGAGSYALASSYDFYSIKSNNTYAMNGTIYQAGWPAFFNADARSFFLDATPNSYADITFYRFNVCDAYVGTWIQNSGDLQFDNQRCPDIYVNGTHSLLTGYYAKPVSVTDSPVRGGSVKSRKRLSRVTFNLEATL